MHPFDIGDRCVIDSVQVSSPKICFACVCQCSYILLVLTFIYWGQMIVEEMNILTTVFLRYDNEKIYYPNSLLLTKPISNFYRSPEMSDAIDFSIDLSTSMEIIIALKKAIQA